MTWDDLRYLEAVARHRSISHAARELGVAPSTVYRRVGELEESFGAPLVLRGTTPLEFTEAGDALAEVARGLRAELARVASDVHDRSERVEGGVRLTTVEGFLPFLVEPLRHLTQVHPALSIQLTLANRGPSVWRREADIAVAAIANPPQGLLGKTLAPVRYGVFGTAAACERTPLRWVLGAGPSTAQGGWEREHAGLVALSTTSRHAVVEFVLAGFGVALLPRRIAALHASLREIDQPLVGLDGLDRRVWLLTHPDLRDVPRVRVVFDALVEALGA